MEDKKTGYKHCLDNEFRILDLEKWSVGEHHYFTTKIDSEEFFKLLSDCKIKTNSTPRKTKPYLNFRMYGFVPYNISQIQKGIQFGHAVVEYGIKLNEDNEADYNKWAKKDKTFIILNGLTTNNDKKSEFYGVMQQHRDSLELNGINHATFYEPDLNNALSAIVFLVDERVYDTKLYPNYVKVPKPWGKKRDYRPRKDEYEKWFNEDSLNHEKWVEKIGGKNNVFLRDLLNEKRLA